MCEAISAEINDLSKDEKELESALHHIKRHQKAALDIYKKYKQESQANNSDKWKSLHDHTIAISGKDIIKSMRSHLTSKQHNRCCYCKRWLYNIAYSKPVEHILPRATHPQFCLEYRNLAAACYDCNQIKSNSNWEPIDKNQQRYPEASYFRNSFHPKYHKYKDHINYLRAETNDYSICMYMGLTPQGKHLCEKLLAQIAEMEVLASKNKEYAADILAIQESLDDLPDKTVTAIEAFLMSARERMKS